MKTKKAPLKIPAILFSALMFSCSAPIVELIHRDEIQTKKDTTAKDIIAKNVVSAKGIIAKEGDELPSFRYSKVKPDEIENVVTGCGTKVIHIRDEEVEFQNIDGEKIPVPYDRRFIVVSITRNASSNVDASFVAETYKIRKRGQNEIFLEQFEPNSAEINSIPSAKSSYVNGEGKEVIITESGLDFSIMKLGCSYVFLP
ncbi:MAG: hypothetical protein Q7S22_01800 [Candidatus Micrarchaeota archaeon]|nr:hypothetical protein [Candidatus Micrarchaeota archaeon]